MSTPRPATPVPDAGDSLEKIEVDWAALPDDWRERNHRHRSGSPGQQPNIVRAQVAEGIIGVGLLDYAAYLEDLQVRFDRVAG